MKRSLNHTKGQPSKEQTLYSVYVRAIEWLVACVLSIAFMVVFMFLGLPVAVLLMLITAMWCAWMSFRSIYLVDALSKDDTTDDTN